MSNNLQLFWQLASSSPEERLSSSDKLVSDLLAQQSALASSSNPSLNVQSIKISINSDQDDSNHALDPLSVSDQNAKAAEDSIASRNVADLTYALRRLIRGLASPRENSRLGFAVALTELLSNLETVTTNEVLTLLIKYSATQASMSGQEHRDMMFAKLFGVLALIQSRLLFKHSSSLNDFKSAIQVIFALFSSKAWMGESCGWVITQTVDHLNRQHDAPTWRTDALQWIAERTSASKDLTPEKFAVIFKLAQTNSVQHLDALIVPPFKNAHLLSPANLPVLARILKDSSPSDTPEGSNGSRSSFRPQLHFVWDVILDAYFSNTEPNTTLDQAASFPEFFKVIVDESLFSSSASTERKSWGFQVFSRSIARARDEHKPLLFTPNFMRTWINQLSNEDRFLHKASLKAAEAVQDAVKNNPQLGFVLLSQLIGEHGNQNFDRITKTKTVESILSSLDVHGVKDYLKHLRDLVCQSEDSSDNEEHGQAKAGQRAWSFDQILSLVRNTAIPKDDDLISDILEFFIAHGYFNVKQVVKKSNMLNKLPEPGLSDKAKQQCRSRLLSCLSELSGQTTVLSNKDGKTRKALGVTSTGVLWLQKAHDIMLRFGKEAKNFTTIFDQNSEIEAIVKAGTECLAKLQKKEASTSDTVLKEQLRAFQSLLLAGLIVSVDSEDGATDLVEPLCDYADTLWPANKGKSKREKSKDKTEDGEDIDASVVLVDCLVNFLELPSVLLRTVAAQTFEAFTRDMTTAGLDHLLVQLGQTEYASSEAMDVDHEAEQDDGAEELSDTSVTSDDDSDNDEAKSDIEESEDDDDESEVDAELRAKVQEALRDSGLADPEEDNDEKDKDDKDEDVHSDASSELLDDDQMMLLDDKLGEIFRQTRSAKSGRKEAKKEENVLKNKLLDLVEIFARKESGNKLVLRLVSPLFGLARDEDSDDSQLSKRAANILRTRLCKGKDSPEGVTTAEVIEDLEQVHQAARSSTHGEVTNLASLLNLYLTKVVLSGHPAPSFSSQDSALVRVYKETLTDLLTRKKSNVKPAFLIEAFRRFPLLGWMMREDLLESCRPKAAAHAFRQLQAMQMLQVMMTQIVQLPEKEQIIEFVPHITKCICEIVSSAATDADSSFNANRLKESIKFVVNVARLSKRVLPSGDKFKTVWKLNRLQDVSHQLQSSERFKASTSIHALFKQLFAILESPGAEKTSEASAALTEDKSPAKTAKGSKKRAAVQADSAVKKSASNTGSPKKAKIKSA